MTGLIKEMRRVVASVVGDDKKANDVVCALIKSFGGERLYIPHNDYEKRNNEIKELSRSGASVEQLAKRFRLSRKTVANILSMSK